MIQRPRALKCETRGEELKQWADWTDEVANCLAVQDEIYQTEM